ncbi:MAG: DUF924 domain-containing protein [Rubellimicrobium sp.]|nr:DUF924 domain-containing protein [Rubellimicrobium sp.]
MDRCDAVIDFWIREIGPAGWYAGTTAIDEQVRDRFADLWHEAMDGGLGPWLVSPAGALAYLIVTDQFPRNIFRDDPRAFASDAIARAAAKLAIANGWDMEIPEPERQFFYLPLMHAENLVDQDRSVEMFATRMPETNAENLAHAEAHREVIRRYGRFPTRNAALGRENLPEEERYLAEGGYGAVLAAFKPKD